MVPRLGDHACRLEQHSGDAERSIDLNQEVRLDPEKLAAVFQELGASRWRMRRSLIYYQPWTFRFYRWLEPRPLAALFRAAFFAGNFAIGRWGNSLRSVAWKNTEPEMRIQ